MTQTRPRLIVIDAMSFIFRSYHAIPPMTNPGGESTNALFGFVRSVLKLLKDFSPEFLVVVFDGPENERSRKSIYPAYKAHRSETPRDLYPQFGWSKTFCDLRGLSTISIEGVEADDTIGAVALWGEREGMELYLASNDKDLAQLVSPNVSLLNVFKDNRVLGPQGVLEEYGVEPSKIRDFLAITGDSSDNVPGVAGIGPKGARELLNSWGSVDGILNNLNEIKGKKGEALEKNKELLLLSRQLVSLDTTLPIPKEKEFYLIQKGDLNGLENFYKTQGFQSLQEKKKVLQRSSRGHLVQTEVELKEVVEKLKGASEICIDTETTSQNPMLAKPVGIGIGASCDEVWYIPTSLEFAIPLLKPLIESKPLIGHNIKYDLHILTHLGIQPTRLSFDTMLASYLLQAEERQHNLDTLTLKEFDHVKIPLESLLGKGKEAISMDLVPVEKVAEYCCEDVEMTLRLKELYLNKLKERGLENLYNTLELPLVPILKKMEETGIFLDVETLKGLSKLVQDETSLLERQIFELAGETFNLNSPKQLGVILFEKLGIGSPKKTATGYSTSASVLEAFIDRHPIIPLVLEYRTVEKLRSTYIDSLPSLVNPNTGRIHSTFNQSVAATGRLSSQDPNLQNIPIRTPLGREIRGAFKPGKEGWVFLSADYSQIELRLLAHLSEDPLLIEALTQGEDVHKTTASNLFEVPLEEVTSDMRARAKAVNYGIIYGQQAFGLSQELTIPVKEAQSFINLYFKKHEAVKAYLDRVKQEARLKGGATTMTGRERKIPDLKNPNPQIRQAAERLATNTPLQGSAADLIKAAMISVDREMRKNNLEAKLLLQIHDELLFEVPEYEVESIEKIVKNCMERVWELKVPLVVATTVGRNWKDC